MAHILFNGLKFFLHTESGYFRASGGRKALHREIYIAHHGPIPQGWHVHHINGARSDNRLENLHAIPKGEHMRLHRMEDGSALRMQATSQVRDVAGKCKECGAGFTMVRAHRSYRIFCGSKCRDRWFSREKWQKVLRAREAK